ncbi:MAG: hypothetical protein P4L43_18675 [Syntrophobacteraceae bacterium]|nr:hypothetical protein [Syntrophobacteraceae bacterium]
MKHTANDQSSFSNSPTTSQEARLTLEDALKLLDLTEVPGGPDYSGIFLGGTQRLLDSKGKDWVIKHRKGLVEEMKMVASL